MNSPDSSSNLPAIADVPLPRELVKAIAMDIGKEIAAHVEVMYPDAVRATSKTMLLSVRNSIYNEIMAALDTTDAEAIQRRLERRKQHRRRHKAAYRSIRQDEPPMPADDPAGEARRLRWTLKWVAGAVADGTDRSMILDEIAKALAAAPEPRT